MFSITQFNNNTRNSFVCQLLHVQKYKREERGQIIIIPNMLITQ